MTEPTSAPGPKKRPGRPKGIHRVTRKGLRFAFFVSMGVNPEAARRLVGLDRSRSGHRMMKQVGIAAWIKALSVTTPQMRNKICRAVGA